MNTYTQLTEQERYQIYALKQVGQSDCQGSGRFPRSMVG